MIGNDVLKKKILDSAIHGTLVKNNLELKPVDVVNVSCDVPFDIPENWRWVKVSSVVDMVSGGTPSRSNKSYWEDGNIPFVKIGDMSKKYVDSTQEFITKNGLKNSSAKLFEKGTILYSIFASIGVTSILNIQACTNQAILGVTPKSENIISNGYLYYILMGISDYLKSLGKGTSQMNINQKVLKESLIPIPPLEEQKRIVEEIDVLLDLIDKKEKNDIEKDKLKEVLKIKILDNAIHGNLVEKHTELNAKKFVEELKQAKDEYIINNKLSKSKDSNTKNELFDIPNHWCWTTLGDICFVTKLAGFEYTKYVAKDLSSTGEVPVVRAQNIKPNLFVDNCQEFISNDLSQKLYRCALDSKCVLMTFIGAGIGEVCVFDKEKRYHLAPNVAKIVPGIDINKYIMYYLMSKEGKKNIFDYKKSTAQASLSMETIRNVVIPIPPFVELKEIVEKVERLFELIEQL